MKRVAVGRLGVKPPLLTKTQGWLKRFLEVAQGARHEARSLPPSETEWAPLIRSAADAFKAHGFQQAGHCFWHQPAKCMYNRERRWIIKRCCPRLWVYPGVSIKIWLVLPDGWLEEPSGQDWRAVQDRELKSVLSLPSTQAESWKGFLLEFRLAQHAFVHKLRSQTWVM